MAKAYLGIDPGAKGFLTLQTDDRIIFTAISEHSHLELGTILNDFKVNYPDMVCVMEEVHAIFGSSAKATFTFGEIFGILQGLLIAHKIPYHLVPPKKWQLEMWENCDKVYKTGKTVDTKQTSFNAARRMFPDIDLRRTPKCTKLDDNKCDSLLISEYARRKNL